MMNVKLVLLAMGTLVFAAAAQDHHANKESGRFDAQKAKVSAGTKSDASNGDSAKAANVATTASAGEDAPKKPILSPSKAAGAKANAKANPNKSGNGKPASNPPPHK